MAKSEARRQARHTGASGTDAIWLGISGGLAGAIAKTTVAPLERAKLLMQTGNSRTLSSALQQVVHHEGWRALWRGNTVAVARMVPSKAVLLASSDLYKDAVRTAGRTDLSTFALGGISGALAGATAALATYPLDLARTRMAGVVHTAGKGNIAGTNGAIATLLNIQRQEGSLALFRGASPTVLGALPYEGIKFGTYDWLKRTACANREAGGAALLRASCGAAAAIVAHALTYPNDVIRRRLQLQGVNGRAAEYSGWLDCMRQVVRREGVGALYRGLGVTILRSIPNTGIQFMVYEACKDLLVYMELH